MIAGCCSSLSFSSSLRLLLAHSWRVPSLDTVLSLPFSWGAHVSVFLCQHQLPVAQCPYLASCLSFFFRPLFLEGDFWQALLLLLCYNNRGSSKEKCWSLAWGDSSCNQCHFLRFITMEASHFIDDACSSCSDVGALGILTQPAVLLSYSITACLGRVLWPTSSTFVIGEGGLENPVLSLQSWRKTSVSLLNHRKILWAQEPARAVPTSLRCVGTGIYTSVGLCPIKKALRRPAWKGCMLGGAGICYCCCVTITEGPQRRRLCMWANQPAQCSA